MKKLKIYIDESGDFGFNKNSSILYVVSFIFCEYNSELEENINYLNNKLFYLGFNGMIHMNSLMAARDEYKYMDYNLRKKIFLALFNFINKSNLKIRTIIIEKDKNNSKKKFYNKLLENINEFYQNSYDLFKKYKNIEIYYDDGQEYLTKIIKKVFITNPNFKLIDNFDHEKERIFQVADMIATIDKIIYKKKNKIKLSHNEDYFFSNNELNKLVSKIKKKRF